MASFPSFDDLFDAARREALIKPTRFNPRVIDTKGTDVNVAFAVCAAMGEEVSRAAQSGFNEAHQGLAVVEGPEALQRYVYDRYQIIQYGPQSAVAVFEITRGTAADGVTIPDGATVASGGVQFLFANEVPFPQGVLGPIYVFGTCQQTGSIGNIEPVTMDRVSGVPEGFTVRLLEPANGGHNGETLSELQARSRDFYLTARRGTLRAIETGGRTPRVSDVSIDEVFDPASGLAVYRVTMAVVDRDGGANEAMLDEVRENLREYRCLGVPVGLIAGVPEYVSIVVQGLLFQGGSITSAKILQVRRAILAEVNLLRPNEVLTRAAIISAIKRVEGVIVPDGAVVEPAGDLVPIQGRVFRTRDHLISINGVNT